MGKILVIDDTFSDRLLFRRTLSGMGHEVSEAVNGEDGLKQADGNHFDLVLLDFKMPGMDGIETLRQLKAVHPLIPVVLVTASDEADSAIEAMQIGAFDYLTKPVELTQFMQVVSSALEASQRMNVRVEIEDEDEDKDHARRERIVGHSKIMWELFKKIGQCAPTDATVLLTGESGTGKELVARAIYQHSNRAEREFVVINCAAIPDALLESDLFGHEKGSFTDAHQRHIGKFEQAHGGTIFLDEIGEMNSLTQAKLLRVIQEKTFERVGGNETLQCDVRIIAATNRNLQGSVEQGSFRKDLFFRLNVVPIFIAPLRERREDLPALCDYLLKRIAHELGKPQAALSGPALRAIKEYNWPGNVRELQNQLTRAMVTAPTPDILTEHLSLNEQADPNAPGILPLTKDKLDQLDSDLYSYAVTELERHLFKYVLERTGGNQVQASKLLGVSRNMVRGRIDQFGLEESRPKSDGPEAV